MKRLWCRLVGHRCGEASRQDPDWILACTCERCGAVVISADTERLVELVGMR